MYFDKQFIIAKKIKTKKKGIKWRCLPGNYGNYFIASYFIIYQYCFISTVTDEAGKNANCEYIISHTHWRFRRRSTVDYFLTVSGRKKKRERKKKEKNHNYIVLWELKLSSTQRIIRSFPCCNDVDSSNYSFYIIFFLHYLFLS